MFPVRGTKLIAISTGIVLAVAAIIVFAAGAAARRAAPHGSGGVATTSRSVPASGRGHAGGLTAVSAGIGLRRGAVSPSAAGIAAAKATLPKLTTLQLAGQRVIYSYPGRTPPARLLWLIRHGEVAGVIFFTGNIGTSAADLASFKKVVAELQAANRAATNPVRAPLLLMTDQEGGIVRRLPGPPTLSEKKIGASSNPAGKAATAGRNAASYLRGFGINLNLAPVLDVYRTAGNFIDEFGRSYSSNPAVAAKAGAAFITAQQAGKVAATSKHFPGLGAAATAQNTDARPVTLT